MKEKFQSEFSDRQKMLQPNFELFYYADTTLRHVKPHKHDDYELLFFLSGDVHSVIGSSTYQLHYGDVTLIPPGIFHYTNIAEGQEYRRFTLWISKEFMQTLQSWSDHFSWLSDYAEHHQEYRFHLDQVEFQEILTTLFRILESGFRNSFADATYASICCAECVLSLTRMIHSQKTGYEKKENQSLFDGLLRYIQVHLEEDLSLEKLSSHFFVSKSYLSHLFKDNMGISLHQYVIKKRLEHVRNDILQNIDISQAVENTGFKNYSSFYRAFIKEYGISPKEYRSRYIPDEQTSAVIPNDKIVSEH